MGSVTDIADLARSIRTCRLCPLARTRRRACPIYPPRPAPLVLLGEAPGRDENLAGRPFVGRSGQHLNQLLASAGIHPDDFTVMNVIACRPPDNDFGVAVEVGAVEKCRPWMDRQLEASGSWLGVAVGKVAAGAVFGEVGAMKEAVGRMQWVDGRLWSTVFHPAYLLRQRNWRLDEQVIEELRAVKKVMTGERPVPGDLVEVVEWLETEERESLRRSGVATVEVEGGGRLEVTTAVEDERRLTLQEVVRLGGVKGWNEEMVAVGVVKREMGVDEVDGKGWCG